MPGCRTTLLGKARSRLEAIPRPPAQFDATSTVLSCAGANAFAFQCRPGFQEVNYRDGAVWGKDFELYVLHRTRRNSTRDDLQFPAEKVGTDLQSGYFPRLLLASIPASRSSLSRLRSGDLRKGAAA
jgi:hypothetical protein